MLLFASCYITHGEINISKALYVKSRVKSRTNNTQPLDDYLGACFHLLQSTGINSVGTEAKKQLTDNKPQQCT